MSGLLPLCQLTVSSPPEGVVDVIGRLVRFGSAQGYYFPTTYLPLGSDEGDCTGLLLVLFCSYGVVDGAMMLVFASLLNCNAIKI